MVWFEMATINLIKIGFIPEKWTHDVKYVFSYFVPTVVFMLLSYVIKAVKYGMINAKWYL